jgi:hypothetical protein
MEVSNQLHSLAALCPGKRPQYPLWRRFDGLQSQFGCYGEEKIPFLLPGIEPRFLSRLARSLVGNTYWAILAFSVLVSCQTLCTSANYMPHAVHIPQISLLID